MLIVDVDGTLTWDDSRVSYSDRLPKTEVIDRVNALHARGAIVTIHSARNMRTYNGDIRLIKQYTLPILIDWLDRHGVCYDEIYMGKPWCGPDGFYVQARSLRPKSFVKMSVEEIAAKLGLASDKGASGGRNS
jgi:capsule biosynthesis phosphatase